MTDLYTQIDEGEYSIEIKETRRGRFPVLNKGNERTLTKEEDEELREMMKKYKNIILDLHDIDQEYNGNDRVWHLGRKMSGLQENDQANIQALFQILPIERFSDSSAYRYRLFYEAFPEGEGESRKSYNPNHRHTVLSELVQRVNKNNSRSKYEVARDVYDRVRENDRISQDEVRAWSVVAEESDLSLPDVISAANERIDKPNVENIKTIYQLLGEESPSKKEINSALN